MNKDIKKLLEEAQRNGAEVIRPNGGHLKVYSGLKLVTVASSSSPGGRAVGNLRAQLRKAGLVA